MDNQLCVHKQCDNIMCNEVIHIITSGLPCFLLQKILMFALVET